MIPKPRQAETAWREMLRMQGRLMINSQVMRGNARAKRELNKRGDGRYAAEPASTKRLARNPQVVVRCFIHDDRYRSGSCFPAAWSQGCARCTASVASSVERETQSGVCECDQGEHGVAEETRDAQVSTRVETRAFLNIFKRQGLKLAHSFWISSPVFAFTTRLAQRGNDREHKLYVDAARRRPRRLSL